MASDLQNKPPLLGAGLRPAAILFDLDGTLVDSATDLALAVNRCLQEFDLPAAEEAAVRGWVGNGAAKLVERALCDRLSCEPAALESGLADKALQAFFRHYEACCTETTQLYPGVEQTLAQLQSHYPMACVTNKPERYARRLLDHLQLPFAVLIGGDPGRARCRCRRLPDGGGFAQRCAVGPGRRYAGALLQLRLQSRRTGGES